MTGSEALQHACSHLRVTTQMLLLFDCPFKSPLHAGLTYPTGVSLDLTSSRGFPTTSQGKVGSPWSCSHVPGGSARTIITHWPFWVFHKNASSLCACLAHVGPQYIFIAYICDNCSSIELGLQDGDLKGNLRLIACRKQLEYWIIFNVYWIWM